MSVLDSNPTDMETPVIRKARPADIEKMMTLYEHSRSIMRSDGNFNQWVGGYPSPTLVANDIDRKISYIIERDGIPVGCFVFIIGRDPTYTYIENGSWQEDDRPYGTIHRIASTPYQHGIFETCIDWCRKQTTSLRIDTHADNRIMQHLVEKHGFNYRGIIYVDDGTQRLAFQMLDTKTLCEPLQEYIDRQIIPQYQQFDSAHQCDHAEKVIANSLNLANHYPVDVNMVYTIAAYHDLGLRENRDLHHIMSGKILLADNNLHQWFSQRQTAIMAEAVEDHRASSDHEPRTIYGKIVAEADRDIEPLKIIERTVLFGKSHYPHLDREDQWERTCKHLEEKYGRNGYLKLWLPESHNSEQLAALQQIIDNKTQLKELFNRYFIR